jgi:signal transduction histidine kinase
MSSLAVIGLAHVRAAPPERSLADALIVAFATADDVASGIERVVALLEAEARVGRVEWWAPVPDGTSLRLETAAGDARGPRAAVPFGPVGALVVESTDREHELLDELVRLVPVVRRRWTEERLADHAALLARRVQALDDFAALVAHELKSPLHRALLSGPTADGIEEALALVDSVLDVVRSESARDEWSAPAPCLGDALCDLGGIDAEVCARLPHEFPLPAAALRLVLRNLLANAAAAGAGWIDVWAAVSPGVWTLGVDDDGVGAGAPEYAGGSGIGLALCRRLVERLGGELELRPRPDRGTSARIALRRGDR